MRRLLRVVRQRVRREYEPVGGARPHHRPGHAEPIRQKCKQRRREYQDGHPHHATERAYVHGREPQAAVHTRRRHPDRRRLRARDDDERAPHLVDHGAPDDEVFPPVGSFRPVPVVHARVPAAHRRGPAIIMVMVLTVLTFVNSDTSTLGRTHRSQLRDGLAAFDARTRTRMGVTPVLIPVLHLNRQEGLAAAVYTHRGHLHVPGTHRPLHVLPLDTDVLWFLDPQV